MLSKLSLMILHNKVMNPKVKKGEIDTRDFVLRRDVEVGLKCLVT